MARLRLSHTEYKYSDLATALDTIGNIIAVIGLFGGISVLYSRLYPYCLLFVILIGVGFFLKHSIAPSVAIKVFEKKKKRMMREREGLALQHIYYVDKDDYSLIIKCPKCTKPVSINSVCSCGCDVWRRDFLFKEEIEKIRKTVYDIPRK